MFIEDNAEAMVKTNGRITSSCHKNLGSNKALLIFKKKRNWYVNFLLPAKKIVRAEKKFTDANKFDVTKLTIRQSCLTDAILAEFVIISID